MKIAIAGKGGVGKTTIAAWLGDYLNRQKKQVWLIDADTAISLGPALGLSLDEVPTPLVNNKKLIQERVGTGVFINLNPDVKDLPQKLAKDVRGMKLLVMGTISGAGAGCGCAANALLKALLAYMILRSSQWMIVDLEAGVEHLGRGTITSVDGLVVVSEPSIRGLQTASNISRLAKELGLKKQVLVLNRADDDFKLPENIPLPKLVAKVPYLESLAERQKSSSCVLDLPDLDVIDKICEKIIQEIKK
ncbi:ArsA-related P-loop ATPase [Desulfothermus naphthae]